MTTQKVVADEVLGRFARQQHDWFERVRKGSLDPEKVARAVHAIIDAQYPDDGVEFELTLNFDAPEADPIGMVRGDGYGEPEKWRFTGAKLYGIHTKRFKLVRVGYCCGPDEVRERIAGYGPIPEGQWREAFKAAFPKPDGNGPVGFAGSSWVYPNGYAGFPIVYSDGLSCFFRWADGGLGGDWRWLVPASKAS
ncbi:MAG: hypothetical protein HY452_00705 [Parcubacteria group bacterium]|nr:hypothetical protein [Parcubacteria group bacterium]